MGGAFLFWGYPVKPPLSWDEQVDLLVSRGLIVADQTECARAIADEHGAYGRYLDKDFYTEIEDREPTVMVKSFCVVYEIVVIPSRFTAGYAAIAAGCSLSSFS